MLKPGLIPVLKAIASIYGQGRKPAPLDDVISSKRCIKGKILTAHH